VSTILRHPQQAMPKITFIQPDGSRETIEAETGRTAMEAARDNNIRGIRAQCGGECSCSTCHCYVDDAWLTRLPLKKDDEASLIEFAWEPREASRLACQVILTEALDGLVLHVPEKQL
jgi:ferredoxin, 2Fe-2S